MLNITDRHVQIAGLVGAISGLSTRWVVGVLIGKVIGIGTSNVETEVQLSSLNRFILLRDLSFVQTVILAAVIIVTKSIFESLQTSLALLRAVRIGRILRGKVMERATIGAVAAQDISGSASDTNTNVEKAAVDLVLKTKIMQDYLANEEHNVFYNKVSILLCVITLFVVMWWAGFLAVGVLGVSKLLEWTIEKFRAKYHDRLEAVSFQVQRRLLDVVKNSTMIQMMDMASTEHDVLQEMEKESDETLLKDVLLRFIRVTSQVLPLAFLPVALVAIQWAQISEWSVAEAQEAGTTLLIVMLLLNEAHTSVVHLSAAFDQEVAYLEAWAAVDAFIGNKELPSPAVDHDSTESMGTNYDLESSTNVKGGPASFQRRVVPGSQYLSVDGITLFYSGRSQPVLQNVSKSFARGKIHAIVGESGSGKSTTINVFAGLLVPKYGTMTVWDGMKVAYVSQDQTLLGRTIRENVTYGMNPEKELTEDNIWQALATAKIASWVSSLPLGLDQLLEDGEDMVSGGQLQRLHLAHLFCTCQDADLVILDECMSALDHNSRRFLTEALNGFLRTKQKTALVITHHNEILDVCDEIHDFTSARDAAKDLMMSAMKDSMKDLKVEDTMKDSKEGLIGDRSGLMMSPTSVSRRDMLRDPSKRALMRAQSQASIRNLMKPPVRSQVGAPIKEDLTLTMSPVMDLSRKISSRASVEILMEFPVGNSTKDSAQNRSASFEI